MAGTFRPYSRIPGKGDPYGKLPDDQREKLRHVVATVTDMPTISDLLAYLSAEAPDMDLDDVYLLGGHVRWTRKATAEEVAEKARWKAEADVRKEEWERAMLVRLLEKYGTPY